MKLRLKQKFILISGLFASSLLLAADPVTHSEDSEIQESSPKTAKALNAVTKYNIETVFFFGLNKNEENQFRYAKLTKRAAFDVFKKQLVAWMTLADTYKDLVKKHPNSSQSDKMIEMDAKLMTDALNVQEAFSKALNPEGNTKSLREKFSNRMDAYRNQL